MTTIESIKRQIQNMREGLPYIDSAVSRLAEQERIKQLEEQLNELENAGYRAVSWRKVYGNCSSLDDVVNTDTAIHRWCAAVKTTPNCSGAE